MTLIAERSLWDWAERLAAEQGEPFSLVLAEIVTAVDRNELIVTAVDRNELAARFINALNDNWRRLLTGIAWAARTDWTAFRRPLPPDEGGWLLTHHIVIRADDMQKWLASRSPAAEGMDSPVDSVRPRRRSISKSTKVSAVADFITSTYPNGIPAGVTDKTIVRSVEAKMKIKVSDTTVRRARASQSSKSESSEPSKTGQ
jgi:hypothetical protein